MVQEKPAKRTKQAELYVAPDATEQWLIDKLTDIKGNVENITKRREQLAYAINIKGEGNRKELDELSATVSGAAAAIAETEAALVVARRERPQRDAAAAKKEANLEQAQEIAGEVIELAIEMDTRLVAVGVLRADIEARLKSIGRLGAVRNDTVFGRLNAVEDYTYSSIPSIGVVAYQMRRRVADRRTETLIVVNPTGDLPYAPLEGHLVAGAIPAAQSRIVGARRDQGPSHEIGARSQPAFRGARKGGLVGAMATRQSLLAFLPLKGVSMSAIRSSISRAWATPDRMRISRDFSRSSAMPGRTTAEAGSAVNVRSSQAHTRPPMFFSAQKFVSTP
jgi:hypothetical protein